MSCDLTGTLQQTYCLVGQQVEIDAFNDGSGSGDLDITDNGAGGSFDQGTQFVDVGQTVTWYYTPASAGTVTFGFSGGFYGCEWWPDTGNTLTVDTPAPPDLVNCGVTYASSVSAGGTLEIGLVVADDLGGQVWTVTPDDGGSGGSFDPASVQIGDLSSGYPSEVSVQYTAPASAAVVTFNFSADVTNDTTLQFNYTPASLSVLASARKDAFLAFFD